MNLCQSEYLEKLLHNVTSAKSAAPLKTSEFAAQFPASQSDEAHLREAMETIAGIQNAIYIVRLEHQEVRDVKKIKQLMIDYKSKQERSCPKVNRDVSTVMYVGSSSTGLTKRLNQHFGFGYPKTYALQLQYWFRGRVSIEVLDYANTSREVLQLVEDAISAQLKPMFGKQGSNNK